MEKKMQTDRAEKDSILDKRKASSDNRRQLEQELKHRDSLIKEREQEL